MVAKHPQAPPLTLPPQPTPQPVTFSSEQVKAAIFSFPEDTAPGPSQLKANHLKDALRTPAATPGNRVLTALTNLVNTLVQGKVPPKRTPFLCSATLHAAIKKNGGFMPVAIGFVIRRLTSKCLARAVAAEAKEHLSPLQLGVGVRGG
jgi:hypothetical protein